MATVSLHFRASIRQGSHPGSLYLRIIHKRKALSVTTDYRLYKDEWDNEEQKIVFPSGDSPRMKHLLDTEDKINRDLRRLENIIEQLGKEGEYSCEQIVNAFRQNTQGNTLRKFTCKLSFDLNDAGCERTARAYTTASEGLIRFNKGVDVRLEHINSTLIRNFEKYMKDAGKRMNTISFYMRTLRAIYNKAIAEGRMQARFENPFAHVYTGVFATRKRALTTDEIRLLNDLDLTLSGGRPEPDAPLLDETLRRSLAMFMFCFHARGMSFVDMAYLKKKNIVKDTITYSRRKTGQMLTLKITSAMRRVIDGFSNETSGSAYVFPIIKDTKRSRRVQYETALCLQNRRLKKLAKMAGIEKIVSTHVARHSWATIAKKEKYPLLVISEGLGHSNEKTTYTYLASFERNVLDNASERISRIICRRGNTPKGNSVIFAP